MNQWESYMRFFRIKGGYYMISSPCSNCPNKNLPKDKCVKDCNTLQSIQKFQVSIKEGGVPSAIEYAEEGRFEIHNIESNLLCELSLINL